MITSRYESIASLIGKEGAFSDHPADSGGATKYGITHQTLSAWRGRPVSAQEVSELTVPSAVKIYSGLYWDRNNLSSLDIGVAHFIMDSVVQHGQAPVKWLQKLVRVNADGILGAITAAAISKADPYFIIHKLAVKRNFFYEGLGNYAVFKNGWKDRLFAVVIEATQSVGAAHAEYE